MTFTKEQLIEQAKKNIAVLRGAVERIPGASDAAVIHLKLAEITLAALEAEPVAHLYSASFERGHVEGELTDAPGCDMPVYTAQQPLTTSERAELDNYRNAEFMPKNLDRALTIMGVSLPESKEEFNLQAERWMQRLIDRVNRCESELAMQSGADMTAELESARQHIAELEAAPPAPVGDGESPVPLMPDFPGRTLTQRECYRAGFEAGKALKDGWVACSERMPNPNQYVLVCNGVWVGMGMHSDSEHLEDDERWQDEHHEFIDVLHHPVTCWMPLPAAPQQEAE